MTSRDRIDSIRYLLKEYRCGSSTTDDMVYALNRICEELVEVVQVQEEQIEQLKDQMTIALHNR